MNKLTFAFAVLAYAPAVLLGDEPAAGRIIPDATSSTKSLTESVTCSGVWRTEADGAGNGVYLLRNVTFSTQIPDDVAPIDRGRRFGPSTNALYVRGT